MIKKIIVTLLLVSMTAIIFAESTDSDFVKTNYKQKSAAKALMFSAIFPGAGQFYASPKSITAYIFPVLEVGLWAGYFSYKKKGDDIEKDYQYYANGEVIGTYTEDCPFDDPDGNPYYSAGDPIHRYERWRQYKAQENLRDNANNPFYDTHFRLDGIGEDGTITQNNTQHFYEDIGKYNKYLFGWEDWFAIYGEYSSEFNSYNFHWIFENENGTGKAKWVGNNVGDSLEVYNPDGYDYYMQDKMKYDANNGVYSTMRAKYVQMRKDAEVDYSKARVFSYGILFNHILSAVDAVRVTKKVNIKYLSKNNIKIKLAPVFTGNEISPALIVSKRF